MPNLLFSWKTSVVGLASLLYGVLTVFQEPSIHAAIHDPKLAYAILVAALGVLAKDTNAHGTPGNPLPNPGPPQPQQPPKS